MSAEHTSRIIYLELSQKTSRVGLIAIQKGSNFFFNLIAHSTKHHHFFFFCARRVGRDRQRANAAFPWHRRNRGKTLERCCKRSPPNQKTESWKRSNEFARVI